LFVTLNELCAEVNELLQRLGVEITDGRTASVVTPRNVRYYRTAGLVSPPRRVDGRADYDQVHVDEIVSLKKAQASGVSLEELSTERLKKNQVDLRGLESAFSRSIDTSVRFSALSLDTGATPAVRPLISVNRSDTFELGWSIRIGDITLSGPDIPPTQEQIDEVAAVLRRQPADDEG
jgi:DNA-binding transcriptional MerR regulator